MSIAQPGTARSVPGGRLLVLAGIVLVALNLRTAVAAVSPIAELISAELPLDPIVLGILGAAPPLGFAVAGILGPLLARAAGLEGALLAAIGVMALGHLGRALAPDPVLLVVATLATLLGVGVGNVLLPPLVKRHFPARVGALTALYATLLSVSAALPALVAVPLAGSIGWRGSLGVWFLSALLVAVPWIAVLLGGHGSSPRRARDAAEDAPPAVPAPALRLGRSAIAWTLAGVFAATSINVYTAFAWLPQLLVDVAGAGEAEAGALLALYTIVGFPTALVVPVLAARLRSPAPLVWIGIAAYLAGGLGLLLAPASATWLWVLLAGLGPLHFPLALALIGLRSRTAAGSVALSGFVQGIGYLLAAAGPVVVGALHSATGGWTAPLVLLTAVAVLAVPGAFVLARPETVEDELSRRAARRGARARPRR